ncbi:hypothetical protein AKUH3B111A_09350 [Apilactobacillus kunkeei]|nr:hypothetical protein AKUH3B103M_09380 [Apilactobacillus kunkeei]CAI2618401.1 hypothetical protein AKUH3B104X_09380 [Apilactobacillus kunkeei]CAI2622242.1 hypothetical protein AKUH3B111A_09350 [Apilactobacillus kunkeei]
MIENKLNVLLAERQLTAIDVYKATGISRKSLGNIIHGTNPKADTLNKLCMYLHVTPAEFYIYSPYELNFSAVSTENKNEYKLFTAIVHYQEESLIESTFVIEQIQDRNYVVSFNNSADLMEIINKQNIIFHNRLKERIENEVESLICMENGLIENTKGKVYVTYKMPWISSYQKIYSRK